MAAEASAVEPASAATAGSPPAPLIREPAPGELSALAELCAAHAAYERAGPVPADLAERLHAALSGPRPRLGCLVLATPDGALAGYATFTRDFATWSGAEYTHLDCLYLRDEWRGHGWGRLLFEAVAARVGGGELQWQTPDWNTAAQRFYDRLGGHGSPKVRYRRGFEEHP